MCTLFFHWQVLTAGPGAESKGVPVFASDLYSPGSPRHLAERLLCLRFQAELEEREQLRVEGNRIETSSTAFPALHTRATVKKQLFPAAPAPSREDSRIGADGSGPAGASSSPALEAGSASRGGTNTSDGAYAAGRSGFAAMLGTDSSDRRAAAEPIKFPSGFFTAPDGTELYFGVGNGPADFAGEAAQSTNSSEGNEKLRFVATDDYADGNGDGVDDDADFGDVDVEGAIGRVDGGGAGPSAETARPSRSLSNDILLRMSGSGRRMRYATAPPNSNKTLLLQRLKSIGLEFLRAREEAARELLDALHVQNQTHSSLKADYLEQISRRSRDAFTLEGVLDVCEVSGDAWGATIQISKFNRAIYIKSPGFRLDDNSTDLYYLIEDPSGNIGGDADELGSDGVATSATRPTGTISIDELASLLGVKYSGSEAGPKGWRAEDGTKTKTGEAGAPQKLAVSVRFVLLCG